MSSKRGFHYALEPVLRTRGWELDALRVALQDSNANVVSCQAVLDTISVRINSAMQEWIRGTGEAQSLPVERFAMLTRFLGDLSQQAKRAEAALAESKAKRDDAAANAAAARHALDVIEEHKDASLQQFDQLRASADFKEADDQWNTLQARITTDET